MTRYEYKTVAAPQRAKRFKGVRGKADSFARTVEDLLAAEAVDGWEYYRAENLPCQERTGLFRRVEDVFHSFLVFRREIQQVPSQLTPQIAARLAQNAPPQQTPRPTPAPRDSAPLAQRAGAEPFALRADMQIDPAAPEGSPHRLGPATS